MSERLIIYLYETSASATAVLISAFWSTAVMRHPTLKCARPYISFFIFNCHISSPSFPLSADTSLVSHRPWSITNVCINSILNYFLQLSIIYFDFQIRKRNRQKLTDTKLKVGWQIDLFIVTQTQKICGNKIHIFFIELLRCRQKTVRSC